MMRIPGFQNSIFPTASMPNLSLVANLGLILFLFLIGLEVNMRMFVSNWRVALSVGLAGMILPVCGLNNHLLSFLNFFLVRAGLCHSMGSLPSVST